MAGTTIVSVVLDSASTLQFTVIITALVVFISVVYYTRFRKASDTGKGPAKKRSKGEGGKKDAKKGGNKQPNQNERKNRQQPAFAHPWTVGALKGHTSPVLDLDISPNGKYLASCAEAPLPLDKNQRSAKKDDKPVAIIAGNQKTWDTTKKLQNPTMVPQNPTRWPHKPTRWPQNPPEYPLLTPNIFQELGLTHAQLYPRFKSRVAKPEQLEMYGYPIDFRNGEAYIEPPSLKFFKPSPQVRLGRLNPLNTNPVELKTCCRCKTQFMTTEDGLVVTPEACVYHWGRTLHTGKENCGSVYTCCKQPIGWPGCCTGRSHVSVGVLHGKLEGFVKTKPGVKIPHDGNYGIYALDCEMCFTTKGLDLAKVTLVKPDGTTAYDQLVKPESEVVDLNTRFSGITPAIYKTAMKSLREVQRELLGIVHAETILVGHSLENDLRALRLVHTNVVDTAMVFPHNRGFPYRRALKHIVNTVFRRDIQKVVHDSAEDARASLELVLSEVQKEVGTEARRKSRRERKKKKKEAQKEQ